MNRKVYDTRFFVELFYSKDKKIYPKILEEKRYREKYISAISIHELFQICLAREGKETAKLRVALIMKDFHVLSVDEQVAQISAELRHKYNLSMGDSMIAATALMLGAICISDDPHFSQIQEIRTTWLHST